MPSCFRVGQVVCHALRAFQVSDWSAVYAQSSALSPLPVVSCQLSVVGFLPLSYIMNRYFTMAEKIEIIVNGKQTQVSTTWTVDDLIQDLELVGKQVAVEVNGQIISRDLWSEQPLGSGDRIEIVHFVGGGEEQRCLTI